MDNPLKSLGGINMDKLVLRVKQLFGINKIPYNSLIVQ